MHDLLSLTKWHNVWKTHQKAYILWWSKHMILPKKQHWRHLHGEYGFPYGSALTPKELCPPKAHVSQKVSIQQWDMQTRGRWPQRQLFLSHKLAKAEVNVQMKNAKHWNDACLLTSSSFSIFHLFSNQRLDQFLKFSVILRVYRHSMVPKEQSIKIWWREPN